MAEITYSFKGTTDLPCGHKFRADPDASVTIRTDESGVNELEQGLCDIARKTGLDLKMATRSGTKTSFGPLNISQKEFDRIFRKKSNAKKNQA